MKNTFYTLSFIVVLHILSPPILFSQIPAGYYDAANGLNGTALKSALNNIIKGHIEFPYSSSSTDVWDILKETDRDTLNANNVILLYTGYSVNGPQEYNNGNGWNREHVWAKSHGDFGNAKGPGTDVHHLRPCNIQVNADRGNKWFGNANTPHIYDGAPTGNYYDNNNHLWQPRTEVKGDVARMIFYMATRYEGNNGEPDLEVIDYLPSNSGTNDPVHALLSDLLEWHQEDPVDDWERNRNDIIYYDYQENRNPFIDHPEYAELIWGDTSSVSITQEEINTTRTLIKTTDMMGRTVSSVQSHAHAVLIYIYSDGTKEKMVVVQ